MSASSQTAKDHSKKPKCHYEILSIERNADIGTIKKAWRTAALQWHPDKNNNSTASTEQFRLIQEAYECLSDPIERKWYDEHREGILQGYDSTSDSNISFLFNVMPFQHSGCYSGYHNKNGGFYQVYNHVFRSILEGEQQGWTSEGHCLEKIPIYYVLEVNFGDSTSEWSEVSAFYAAWENFSSCLSYAWVDLYDTRRETNTSRQIRRLMEEDNKKARRNAKRQRNEEILNLIRFVKKRDERVQKQKLKMEKQQREKEEQKRIMAENKKAAIQEAKEAWLLQSKQIADELEAEDLNAGRIRLADLDDGDEFYDNKRRGKKKKKGKKNKSKVEYDSPVEANENEIADFHLAAGDEQIEYQDVRHVVEAESSNLAESFEANGHTAAEVLVPEQDNTSINYEKTGFTAIDGFLDTKSREAISDASISEEEESEEVPDEWRCECCRKEFKSRGQMDNHMKSKKHKETWAKYEKILAKMDQDEQEV